MKNIFIILFVIVSPFVSYSYVLEAKPIAELVKQIQEAEFQHVEDGLAFGFVSIKSCLYVSQDIALLKNYCLPKKDYPAKGYTIISLKFGVIDIYQEQLHTVLKRDINITTFPDIVKDHMKLPIQSLTIKSLNVLSEKLYNLFDAGCWSTNLSYSTGEPAVACNTEGVLHFQDWAEETQAINGDLKAWTLLIEAIETSITK